MLYRATSLESRKPPSRHYMLNGLYMLYSTTGHARGGPRSGDVVDG
jgi:hypothetical protein